MSMTRVQAWAVRKKYGKRRIDRLAAARRRLKRYQRTGGVR